MAQTDLHLAGYLFRNHIVFYEIDLHEIVCFDYASLSHLFFFQLVVREVKIVVPLEVHHFAEWFCGSGVFYVEMHTGDLGQVVVAQHHGQVVHRTVRHLLLGVEL